MALIDQYLLSTHGDFVGRVQAAWVHAALAVASEVMNEQQTVATTGSPTGGTFTLTFNATATAAIAFNATAAQVQTALGAVAGIGTANVVCTGGPLPTGVVVNFVGTLGAMPQNLLTHTDSLTGGSSPAVTVTRTTTGVAVANHTKRQAVALQILQNPAQWAQNTAIAVADNATVQTDFPGPGYTLNVSEATATNDIEFQINSIFAAYVG